MQRRNVGGRMTAQQGKERRRKFDVRNGNEIERRRRRRENEQKRKLIT